MPAKQITEYRNILCLHFMFGSIRMTAKHVWDSRRIPCQQNTIRVPYTFHVRKTHIRVIKDSMSTITYESPKNSC
jgi:hypothetical protein